MIFSSRAFLSFFFLLPQLAVQGHAQERVVIDSLRLLAVAREATREFRDFEKALTAGYKPVGPHSPAMGQHWINTAALLAPEPNAERPALLTYLSVGDARVLVGVGYAVRAEHGVPRANNLAEPSRWHVHSGNVLDEGFFVEHAAAGHGHPGGIAVLHVWAWIRNPDGMFGADNWALAHLRAGLDTGSYHSRDAARALGTIDGGYRFTMEQMRRTATLSAAQETTIATELERTASAAASLVRRSIASGKSHGEEFASLWSDFWTRLARKLPREIHDKLENRFRGS